MQRLVLFFLAGLALLSLSGCEEEMGIVASSTDVRQIASAIGSIFTGMFLLRLCCFDDDFGEAIWGGGRLTGLTILFISPLQLVIGNVAIFLYLLAFGAALTVATSVMIKDKWHNRVLEWLDGFRTRRDTSNKEAEVEKLKDELRTAKERLDQQEARIARQERKADGQEGPYGR